MTELEQSEFNLYKEFYEQHEVCMCGSLCKDHYIGSGHAPVSAFDYHISNLEEHIKNLENGNATLQTLLVNSIMKGIEPLTLNPEMMERFNTFIQETVKKVSEQ